MRILLLKEVTCQKSNHTAGISTQAVSFKVYTIHYHTKCSLSKNRFEEHFSCVRVCAQYNTYIGTHSSMFENQTL